MTEDERLSTEFFGFGKKKERTISIDEYNAFKNNLSNEYKKMMGIAYNTFKQCMKIIYENVFDKDALKKHNYTYDKFLHGQYVVKFRPINAVLSRLDKIVDIDWEIKDDKYFEKYGEDNKKRFSSLAVFYEGNTTLVGIVDKDDGYKCLKFTYDENGKPNGRKQPFGFCDAIYKINGNSEYGDWFDNDSISHIQDFDIPDIALAIVRRISENINKALSESVKKYGTVYYMVYSPGEGYDICFGFNPNFRVEFGENSESKESVTIDSIDESVWYNPAIKKDIDSKDLLTYDIDNAWLHALNELGYPKIAKDINNTPKSDRIRKIKEYEKTYPDLLKKCEDTWLKWVKEFIKINKIDISSEIIEIKYDAVVLKQNTDVKHTKISKNVEFSLESLINSTEEAKSENIYSNYAHTDNIYNKIISEFESTVKRLYSSKLLEKNLERAKKVILDIFDNFPARIDLLNDYLKHLGVKDRYTNQQFKNMVKEQLDKYVTITPLNEILKKINECKKYTTSSIVGKPFGDEDMNDLNSTILETLSFDNGYKGNQLPFHFTFYNFKSSKDVLYKEWYLKKICKLNSPISFKQLKRIFTHKDKLMSGLKNQDDFYRLADFDELLIDYHVPSARDSEKEVLYKDLVILNNMLKKFGELELEYHYLGTAFAFYHVKIDNEWLKTIKENTGKSSRNDEGDDDDFSSEAVKFNSVYDTVIILRYDGPSKWDDNCMAIQLVYENGNWTINDTSVSKVFNKKEIEEALMHCKNKQKSNAKVLILANENAELRDILVELGYEFKSLYEILPEKLKKSYPLLTVGEQGSPHPNSQKNMNIDVSFFYKAFNGTKIKSFENLSLSYEGLFSTNDLLKGFTSTHETDTDAKKKTKIFKCPVCKKKYTSAKFLENHVLQEHSDLIPRNMPVAQYIFNLKNKKEHGNCVICKRPTNWNEKINKYHRFCSQKCKDAYIKEARARLVRVYGTDNLAKDPEHQKKMLENRKISKKYTFNDGGVINCVGSYEYDFIKYCDEVMGFGSKDIIDPSHSNILFRYEFENKERFYIPDYYMPDYNLLIEIKDKGDNNHENIKIRMKAMDNEKFRAVIESNKYNFITICGKDYTKFVELIEYLKSESLDEKADNKLIISIDQSVYKQYNLRNDEF